MVAPALATVTTECTNARSEGYNGLAKHIGRDAFGFRDPLSETPDKVPLHWPVPAAASHEDRVAELTFEEPCTSSKSRVQ